LFARAKPIPKPIDPTESRRQQVIKLLEARDVDPYVAKKIAYGMEPNEFYLLRIYGYASSDPLDAGGPGDTPVLQATYVGSGIRLWSRAIGYASKAPIEDAEIHMLDGAVLDRPLWGKESVKTIKGERVYANGNGIFEEWRDRLKTGRPKKAGGGMTASERRKDRKRKTNAIQRKRETEKRARALEAKGDLVGAARLRRRSQSARKIDL